MSDVRPNWARLTRRAGIAYVAGTGIGAFLAVQVLFAVRRRTRDNALNLFGPLATLRTIMTAILSKHVRNMFIASAVFTLVARRTFARWLPPPMRKGVVGNFVAFFSCAWYLFYRLKVIERPIPRYQRTVWNMAIMERFHVRPFQPVWWAFNAHVQTVLCNGLNCLDDQLQPFSKYDRELLPAFDGNSVVLDWASEGADLGPASPIVLVMHGIVGSAEENYCRNVVKLCLKRGWRPVVNFRWRIDFGENRDIEVAVDTLHARYPRAPIVAIAYSAGAHVLLTYLQRKKKATPLVGAVVVSAGFDLVKMMKYSELPSNKAYHLALSAALRQCITRHVEWDRNLDPEAVRKFVARMGNLAAHESYDEFLMMLPTFSGRVDLPPNNSIAEFGEEGAHTVTSASAPAAAGATATVASTAPRIQTQVTPLTKDEYSPFGNPTAAHYRFTAGNNMHRLAIPTLVLHAEDDPVCVPSFCPMLTQTASSNRNVIVLMTKRGGHSGWHQGSYPTGPSWAEYTAVDFLAGLLAAHAQTAFMLDIVRRSMTHELDTIRAQANAGQPATRGIGSGSGAFTAHGTRAGATAASTGGAGAGSRSSRGSALERVAESGAGSEPDTAAQVGVAGAWYSGVRSGTSDDGSGVDGSPLALRLRTESEPYSPPVISRICSASDLTYPNLNLMTTPPAPVMWSPQRPVPGRRGDEADAGRQPVLSGAGALSSGARPPRSPGHTQFGVPLSPAEARRAGAAAAARGTRGDRRAPAAGGLMP